HKIYFLFLLSSISIFSLQAQWVKVLDLSKEKVGSISRIFPFKSNLIATTDIGTYLSKDSGSSWIKVDSSYAMTLVGKIVANDSIIFANTGYKGIYKSSDSGKSWHIIDSVPNNMIYDIIISEDNLLASGFSHIFLSK